MPGLEQLLINICNCGRSCVANNYGANPHMREQGQTGAIRTSEGANTHRERISKYAGESGNKRPDSLVRYGQFSTIFCFVTNLHDISRPPSFGPQLDLRPL